MTEIQTENGLTNGGYSRLRLPISSSCESSLDGAPLELTVTTSIAPLTPTPSSATTASPSSSTAAAVHSSDCSTLDVGAMIETRTISPSSEPIVSPKSEMENEAKPAIIYPLQSRSIHGASPANIVLKSDMEIRAGARFVSFADFERVFEDWKATNYHPFRVASSETLRLPDGSTNVTFKYRYIVYHCAHYGAPRMRGVGKRPNQNYMPCGCKAMLRLNYSWSENALRVTTLNEDHYGHDATEDAYYKFAAKVKQRQNSSSPPMVNGASLPAANQIFTVKRPRSESPYSGNVQGFYHQPAKILKNGRDTHAETPLNLSKTGCDIEQPRIIVANGTSSIAASLPPLSTTLAATPTTTPALSVLMFNHQQQRQQDAYRELLRLLSVNGGGGNGGSGLVTAFGASGVRECQTESERHRLIIPIMHTLTNHLAMAHGFDFDEKLRDLKAILKKWQLIPHTAAAPPPPPTVPVVSPVSFVTRSSSAAAAAAAMMVQAMSANSGGGATFAMVNGERFNGIGTGGSNLISNGH